MDVLNELVTPNINLTSFFPPVCLMSINFQQYKLIIEAKTVTILVLVQVIITSIQYSINRAIHHHSPFTYTAKETRHQKEREFVLQCSSSNSLYHVIATPYQGSTNITSCPVCLSVTRWKYFGRMIFSAFPADKMTPFADSQNSMPSEAIQTKHYIYVRTQTTTTTTIRNKKAQHYQIAVQPMYSCKGIQRHCYHTSGEVLIIGHS